MPRVYHYKALLQLHKYIPTFQRGVTEFSKELTEGGDGGGRELHSHSLLWWKKKSGERERGGGDKICPFDL